MANARNLSTMAQGASTAGILSGTYGGTGASLSPTTAGNVLFTADGSVWSSTQKIVRATTVATTSGTAIDFTSIPSWVKRVTVILNGVSGSGTSQVQVQIGSGSVTTTGYLMYSSISYSTNISVGASNTTGFAIAGANASNLYYGSFSIFAYSGNIYAASFSGSFNTGALFGGIVGSGTVTLGGVLDRVRLTTVNGTDTFDAGSVNILYE
jgi:hypothetical protein